MLELLAKGLRFRAQALVIKIVFATPLIRFFKWPSLALIAPNTPWLKGNPYALNPYSPLK